jgi:hypothetical protein
MSEQAKRAYEAYVAVVDADPLFGLPVCPQWDILPDRYKEAWRAAVVAAVDSPDGPPETNAIQAVT